MKINGNEVPAKQRSEGHRAYQLDCGRFYITLHEYDAGWTDKEHTHPHAQFGHVLKGSMEVTVEGAVVEQAAGQSIFLSGGRPHSSASPSQATTTLNLYVKPEGSDK